jgi:hypothetical protein
MQGSLHIFARFLAFRENLRYFRTPCPQTLKMNFSENTKRKFLFNFYEDTFTS